MHHTKEYKEISIIWEPFDLMITLAINWHLPSTFLILCLPYPYIYMLYYQYCALFIHKYRKLYHTHTRISDTYTKKYSKNNFKRLAKIWSMSWDAHWAFEIFGDHHPKYLLPPFALTLAPTIHSLTSYAVWKKQ